MRNQPMKPTDVYATDERDDVSLLGKNGFHFKRGH